MYLRNGIYQFAVKVLLFFMCLQIFSLLGLTQNHKWTPNKFSMNMCRLISCVNPSEVHAEAIAGNNSNTLQEGGGGYVTVFGPKRYIRTTGKPNVYHDTFSSQSPTAPDGIITILNGEQDGSHRISSALIYVNGEQIFGPSDFNQKVYDLKTAINLADINNLKVELRSKPTGYLTILMDQYVFYPPTVTIDADPKLIQHGNSSTLTWSSNNSDSCTIEPSIGTVDTSGSIHVYPVETTSYTITAKGAGGSAFESVTVFVNHKPIADAGSDQSVHIDEIVQLDGSLSSDPEGDALTYQWSFIQKPDSSNTNLSNDTSVKPTFVPDAHGTYKVQLLVSDGMVRSDPDTVVFTTVNRAPVITSTPVTTGIEDIEYTYDVEASDPDGDALTYSLDTAPSCMTVDSASGMIKWTPTQEHIGPNNVRVRVQDFGGLHDTQTFEILVENVNDAPELDPLSDYIMDEGTTLSVSLTATDPDGDPLALSVTDLLPTFASFVDNGYGTGSISFAPGFDTAGSYPMTATASDGSLSDSDDFTLTVNNVNRAPSITSSANTSGREDTLYQYDVEASDPDNGDILTYSLDVSPVDMTIDPSTGLIQWTPTQAQIGQHDVTVRVTDTSGQSAIQSFTISILMGRDCNPPHISSIDNKEMDENTTLTFIVSAFHPETDAVPLSISGLPAFGDFTDNGDGTAVIMFNPRSGDAGVYTMGVSANEGGQACQECEHCETYYAPPDGSWSRPGGDQLIPPVHLDLDIVPCTEALLTVSCWGDIENPPNDPRVEYLEVLGEIIRNGSPAQILISEPITDLVFVPGPGVGWVTWIGVCVSYTDSENFTLTVNGLNQAPSITSTPNIFASEGVLYLYDVEAIDPDDDPLTYTLIEAPPGMTIDETTGEISWIPTSDQIGTFTVTVEVSDGKGGTDAQTYTITVEPSAIDLKPASMDTTGVSIDPQTLELSGTVSLDICNNSTTNVNGSYELTLFEDKNINRTFDKGVDTILGAKTILDKPAGEGTITVALDVNGTVSFAQNLIYAFVDSANDIEETDEENNIIHSMSECEYHPPVGQFDPVLEWEWTGSDVLPDFDDVMCTPAVANLNDDNNDGRIDEYDVPDIVFTTFARNYHSDGRLRAISGDGSGELFTITDYLVAAGGVPAIGDIDGDGLVEILVIGKWEDRYQMLAFENDGSFKWMSEHSYPYTPGWGQTTIGITDLNHDGSPEIIWGEVVSNYDGTTKWIGSVGCTLLAADINLDGEVELVGGNVVYRSDGELIWSDESVICGYKGIVNSDNDPYAEIVVVTRGYVYLFEHTGEIIWGPIDIPPEGTDRDHGGPPTIADYDNDGLVEIGIAGGYQYVVLESDGSVKWTSPIQDLSSNSTGSSVFDFDGDGNAEVVYSDETHLRVYRGTDGFILFETPIGSGTLSEYPLIVDVDNDNNAEIVVPSNDYYIGPKTGIQVFGDRNDTWVNTRKIWNQHAYSITNVNDDGTIPSNPDPCWLTHNTFRCNISDDALACVDLTASYLRFNVGVSVCEAQTVEVLGNFNRVWPEIIDPIPVNIPLGPGYCGNAVVKVSVDACDCNGNNPDEVLYVYLDGELLGIIDEALSMEASISDSILENYAKGHLPIIVKPGVGVASVINISANLEYVSYVCPDRSTITARIGNGGALHVAKGLNVAFYDGDPSTDGMLLGIIQTTQRLNPGQYEDVILSVTPSLNSYHDIYVVADDDGTGRGNHREIDEYNNIAYDTYRFCNNPPRITSNPVTLVNEGDLYIYDVDATDPDNDPIIYSLIRFPEGMLINSTNGVIEWDTSQYPSHAPMIEEGLVVYYPFDGDAIEKSGSELHGSISGSLQTTDGRYDSAFFFDGNCDYVYRESNPYFWIPPNEAQTISAWFKKGPGTGVLFNRYGSTHPSCNAGGNSNSRSWILIRVGSAPTVLIRDDNHSQEQIFNALGNYDDNKWHHMVVVINKATSTLTVYMDGEFNSNTTLTQTGSQSFDDPIEIGCRCDPYGNYVSGFNGAIDEFQLYSRALSKEEIKYLYGYYPIIVRAQDDMGAYNEQAYSIDVIDEVVGANSPPKITSTAITSASENIQYKYDVEATDPDDDILTYSLIQAPDGMVIDESTGLITWTTGSGQAGNYQVEVQVDDSKKGTDAQKFLLTVAVNNPPVITSRPQLTNICDPPGNAFLEYQAIPTSCAMDWECFVINGETYLAVANFYNDLSFEIDSKIYKWKDGCFIEIQSISTIGAAAWESFSINDEMYLAVAYDRNNSTYNLDSKIYKWNGSLFTEVQTIPTIGAHDWESFVINDETYLAVANHYDGSNTNLDSKIYKWNGNSFIEIQIIPTIQGIYWESFEIEGETYLASANYGNDSTFNIDSKIYKWNSGSFIEIQSLQTNGAIHWESFEIEGETYLALANYRNDSTRSIDSKIYKWNGSMFIEIQSIPTIGAHDWESFEIEGETYLALANYHNNSTFNVDSKIYKWSGTSFVEIQSITTNGAFDWESFEIEGETYLAVANQYNDSTRNIDSKIYKWNGTCFDTALSTEGVQYTYNLEAIDPDDDPLTYRLIEAPPGMVIDETTGEISWIPRSDQVGTFTVTIEVSDGKGGTDSQTFLIMVEEPENHAPIITSTPVICALSNETYVYDVDANDLDNDTLKYFLTTSPSGMSIDISTGLIEWNPRDSISIGMNINNGLVAYYPFNGNADDKSGNGNHGTVYGVSLTEDRCGNPDSAYRFDGENDYIDIKSVDDYLKGQSSFSVSCWVNFSEFNHNIVIVQHQYRRGFYIGLDPVLNRIYFALKTTATPNSGGTWAGVSEAYDFSLNQWINVVLNWDGQDLEGYVNGNKLCATQIGGSFSSENLNDTLKLRLGRCYYGDNNHDFYLDGYLDDIHIYNRALTEAEIRYLYGQYSVSLKVEDPHGSYDEQVFTISVVEGPDIQNNPPSIISVPITTTKEGIEYQYDVEAEDPDNDPLTFTLTIFPEGMTIDFSTGLITWTPAIGQAGEHSVVVQVDDGRGGIATQEFTIIVAKQDNYAPVVTSNPVTTVASPLDYSYQIIAEDLDGDELIYELVLAPNDMTISTEGLITWPASPDRPDTADVKVLVSDGRGGEATQAWTITVQEVPPPQVTLLMSTNMPNVGDTITVQVQVISNVGITSRSLSIGGVDVTLDVQGIGEYTTQTIGFFDAVATATDEVGQTGSQTRQLLVGDPSDNTGPEVSLSDAIRGAEVTDLYPITGTATDENGVYYEMRMREQGASEWITFANGYGNKVNEELGIFDPTVIRNGVHEIQLYAYDPSGNISTDTAGVIVDGGLKVGQVNFAQEDMSLPGMGFPISVIREYDSRTQGPGDFGPGWNLVSSNVSVTTTGILGEEWGQYIDNFMNVCLIYPNKQVVIRLSDTEIFKFKIDAVITGTNNKCQYLVDIEFLTIRYIPLDGTLGSLEALDFGNDVILQADTITDYDGISIYNPKRFKITTREGTVYVINSETGIESITDQYGHTISYDDAGIHHSSGISITFERGAGNRIERIKDPQGRTVEYHYDEEGYLEKIVQIGGMTGLERIMAQYSYAGEGKSLFGDSLKRDLRTITAPDGTELGQFEYDTRGRMTGLIDANGNRVIYGYDVPDHRQTITDRLGNVTTYTYDNKGNVTSKTDPLGNLTRWEYDENGNMIRETLPNGAVSVKTYNAAGDVLTETDALGNTTSFTYDAAGRILTKTDPLGRVYTTERDANGNPIREYGPLGDTIRSTYDAEGNLITQKGMNGVVSAFAYNENGLVTNTETYMESDPNNILSRQETEYDSEVRPVRSVQYVNVGEPDEGMIVTQNEYDDWGNLIRDINPSGTSEFRYDGNGRKIASANHLGQWTHYVYNDQGRLIKTILPDENEDNDGDPADPSFDPFALEDNPFTVSTYDAEGRILTSIDMFGNVTIYEYDVNGNRIRTIHPDGTQSMQVYDAVGNVIAMVDRLGNTTSYEHDLIGCQTVRIDALGNQWTTQYDAAGNRIASINPLGRITQYVYDEADRLIQTVYPDGSQTSRTYDIHGNVTSETDQAGRTTWMSYNQLNRLVEVRHLPEANTNDMAVTNYEYDKQGRKVAQIDALGRRTTWTYDIYGRVTSRTLPEGQTETFTYLPDGRKESHTDFNGQVTTYDYDNKGRLIGTSWIDGINDNIPDISYQYDSTGRITEAAKGSVTVQYIYDNIRKSLASLIYPGIGRIDYEYYPLGRRIGLTTITGTTANPRVRRIDYSFDALSRIQSVTSAHGTTLYQYDKVGNQTQMITTDGIDQLITTYGYDHLNRVISIYAMDTTGKTIASYNYTLDPSGMVMDIMEHGGRTVSYTYDNLARLLTETVSEIAQPEKTWTFAYDKVGNRTSQARPDGEVITYTYDDNDRLLTEKSNVNGLTTFSYNDNGDLIGMDAPTETASYSYDPVGRLIAAQVNRGGNILETIYEYDHNNNRVRHVVTDSSGTQDISMLVDPTFQFAQVLEEQDAAGNLVAAYTYGNDLLAQQRPEGLRYYHHDRIGSVRMLTTIGGAPINDYSYEAYGSTLAETVTINNHYKYTGEQLIPELDWYYLRARNYSPSIGRFTSVDPFAGVMTQPLTLNKYGYTEGRPTKFVDPSGKMVLYDVMAVSVIWGWIANSFATPGYFAQKHFILEEWQHLFQSIPDNYLEPPDCDIYGDEFSIPKVFFGFDVAGGTEFLVPRHLSDTVWIYNFIGVGASLGIPYPNGAKILPSRMYSGQVWNVKKIQDYDGSFFTVWARSPLLKPLRWLINWMIKFNIPSDATLFFGLPKKFGEKEFAFGYTTTNFTSSIASAGISWSFYFHEPNSITIEEFSLLSGKI